MNFIFKNYPSHPWFANWEIIPRKSKLAHRSFGFKTDKQLGQISPLAERPEWTLQISAPSRSKTRILFNGFIAYPKSGKKNFYAEVITPESGVLWGRTKGMTKPVITSECEISQTADSQWIETTSGTALLSFNNELFCLITKAATKLEAQKLTDHYFSQDFDQLLEQEFKQRAHITELTEAMPHHDQLAAISAESMMRSLRPAEGKITSTWSQAGSTTTPGTNANELPIIAPAWCLINPSIAEELLIGTLQTQTNSGAIAVHLSPTGTSSIIEAPKPLLVKTAENIWKTTNNLEFLTTAVPLLSRHLQWLLHHFDPKRSGLHCWKSSNEPIDNSTFKTDLATADLTVLLLTEIDAFDRLEHAIDSNVKESSFANDRETLLRNLNEQFWNPQQQAYSNAFHRREVIQTQGFPAFSPLLYPELSNDKIEQILEKTNESTNLPGGLSTLSWHAQEMEQPTSSTLHQYLVFQALKTSKPHGETLNNFSRVTLQNFVEWHKLALAQNQSLAVSPLTAAFILNIQATHHYRYTGKSALTGKMIKFVKKQKGDKLDLAIVGIALFSAFSIHLIYHARNAPPPATVLEAKMNTAFVNREMKNAYNNALLIIEHYPDQADAARLLAANIALLNNNYPKATELLREVRASLPDSPAPMISLGLSLQLQGQFAEAQENYSEFCYLFENIFPELRKTIYSFQILAEEQFKAPPKWREIYRIQTMNEL